ncbi:ABC protein [Peniophora sp. CONT]|nr:ABC protein [Peniophora sp. CONT]
MAVTEKADSDVESQAAAPTTAAPADAGRRIELDFGEDDSRVRKHWYQVWLPKNAPPPSPLSLDDAKIIPLASANIFSQLTYQWITPVMTLGWQRSLQATDLWKMDPGREVENTSQQLEQAWNLRVQKAQTWNDKLDSGEARPGHARSFIWHVKALRHISQYRATLQGYESRWRTIDARAVPSLTWALNDVFGFNFWLGGASKVVSDTSQLMMPLIIKAVINFGKSREAGDATNIGDGVGMAIGLFILAIMTSIFQHQFFWRSMTTGVLVRGSLTSMIYKRGVKLTPEARGVMPNSRLVNFVSSDISRIDACAQWFHPAWTAPIQVTVCLIILLVQLGPSALAGFALFVLIVPLQRFIMSRQFKIRKASIAWTDKRAKLLLEILASMRIVKYFTYEKPFLARIFEIRKQELKGIVRIQFAQSANYALAFSLPVLSATLAFVTYSETHPNFEPAIIFASFSLFNLLRQPLLFLPRALSTVADAQNAIVRLTELFLLPTMSETPLVIDPSLSCALSVNDATFQWQQAQAPEEKKGRKKSKAAKKEVKAAQTKEKEADAASEKTHAGDDFDSKSIDEKASLRKAERDAPFSMRHISFEVPRGSLVAIVGTFGSGKSSLLQGLLGDMTRTRGEVTFGGTVGYCPQSAWVQNATLRDNIVFGQPWDEDKYWKVIENASLLADLDALPAGDQTEIGEKGINLSGGQKQRVNIARALYFDADIIIMDDPLSAVDAHVGRALFENAIQGYLRARGKTVILVTHALHFLPGCDYVYTLANGRIEERGTYRELMERDGEFSRLQREFGAHEEQEENEENEIEEEAPVQRKVVDVRDMMAKAARHTPKSGGKLEGRLIVGEKRDVGHVKMGVWKEYWKAGNGKYLLVLVALFSILGQVAQGLNGFTLVWWQENTFNKNFHFYQGLYAGLGVANAVFTLLMGISQDVLGVYASQNLHHRALQNVFMGKMSFFDTTPLGRVVGVFGKDVDALDNQLPASMRMFLLSFSNLPSSIIIITIVEHYFIIAAAAILCIYVFLAQFYGASAREIKRLDSMLRSYLYAHFTESLSGLPTIRSYGEIPRFIRAENYYIDLENRALFLTVTNQRWLAIRLDSCGAVLTFIVAIMAVVGLKGLSAAQIGLALSYITVVTQTAGAMTRQQAELENYMNSVERISHYSSGNAVSAEAAHEIPDAKPPPQWPDQGAIEFKDVRLAYRPGLPDVLKGLSINVHASERIGIVGRTGAGKSSLMTALFRLVELNSGSIVIDGLDISKMGLEDLRSKIAIIPQEPLLFSGTVRTNLDPFNLHDDARLWDALRRSYLVPKASGDGTPAPASRITLDSPVEPDGANLSVGERSLLSLARALVKDSKIVVLDEATASVDLETDSKIQDTIQSEFTDRTLLCIAHRLRTILSYDRILVLDNGNIAEFDTPLNLFNIPESIFRSMCVGSSITAEEIEKAGQKL